MKVKMSQMQTELSNTFYHTNKDVRRGLIFSPYVFNMFINDIIGHTSRGNTHAPSTEGTTMPVFLFTKDLEMPSYTSNGKQKETDKTRN
jgi:hypothetical protein